MFLTTPSLQLDPLWQLSADYAADPRSARLNLIIGVYRDENGDCPTMPSVRVAEGRLVERAPSKEYIGLSGNLEFNSAMTQLILGDEELVSRATTVQTVAGTGALRLLAELMSATGPHRTVYLGTPAYVNHPAILRAARLNVVEYPVSRNGTIDAEAVLRVANSARAGDLILLQGCCHNPTGLSMPGWLWDELADVMARKGVIPFIDQAYFGLGDGLEEDLEGMRRMLRVVPEAIIAVSASKAWGLYSERTGCAIVITRDGAQGDYARGVMEFVARADYSQPPAHGALVVAEILNDRALRAQWRAELEQMRSRLTHLRNELADELIALPNGDAFAGLREQRGMFLRLPFDSAQMDALREQYGTYGIPSGRLSLAGVPASRIPELATAIASVGARVDMATSR
ncbi:aromatic amino acid transaminase [Cryobacterium sp. TMT1-66-1]|uniref:aromatic amino acid transaminase n=1 Tax=Cryobacterium sp. TMT1-66-1 TaxID=1259242 RepID=UPI00106C0E2E|nr:aromatic amino acid transaminase [Cryobacterium sp. TMT1-66-1]TFD07586.1 aminotransferase class I/II-fold pyridoxal phosphate-dependent enzyme [Cryobacterium sp. TMT1-66-1]